MISRVVFGIFWGVEQRTGAEGRGSVDIQPAGPWLPRPRGNGQESSGTRPAVPWGGIPRDPLHLALQAVSKSSHRFVVLKSDIVVFLPLLALVDGRWRRLVIVANGPTVRRALNRSEPWRVDRRKEGVGSRAMEGGKSTLAYIPATLRRIFFFFLMLRDRSFTC